MKTFESKEERIKSITDTINMNLILAASMTDATYRIMTELEDSTSMNPVQMEKCLTMVEDNAKTIEKFATAAQHLADTYRLIREELIDVNDIEDPIKF